MAQKKLLTNGNVFKRTDNRWGGVVWYSDEQGERRRKSFSGTTKQEVNRKITDYIAAFNESKIARRNQREDFGTVCRVGLGCLSSRLLSELPMTVVNVRREIRYILCSETKQ